jgi:hypothetical protein
MGQSQSYLFTNPFEECYYLMHIYKSKLAISRLIKVSSSSKL